MSGYWQILSSSLAGALIGCLLVIPLIISEQRTSMTHILWRSMIDGQALIALCALGGGLLSLVRIRERQRKRLRMLAIHLEHAKQS